MTSCKMACCSRKCRGIFLFFYGLVGVAVGILVGIIFLFHPQLENFNAGLWGLISFVFALADSIYGLLLWTAWKTLRKGILVFFFIGCFGLSLGSVAFAAYLTFAIICTEDGAPLVGTFYLVCVWCFMVFKWSMILTFNSALDDRAGAAERQKQRETERVESMDSLSRGEKQQKTPESVAEEDSEDTDRLLP